jgi:hypothetical protein
LLLRLQMDLHAKGKESSSMRFVVWTTCMRIMTLLSMHWCMLVFTWMNGPIVVNPIYMSEWYANMINTGEEHKTVFFKLVWSQVDVLSRVRHRNLVALVGYCQEDKQQILIYEYMKNGSLYDQLFGKLFPLDLPIAEFVEFYKFVAKYVYTVQVYLAIKAVDLILSTKFKATVQLCHWWIRRGLKLIMHNCV